MRCRRHIRAWVNTTACKRNISPSCVFSYALELCCSGYSPVQVCSVCTSGKYDHDTNPATECLSCGPGHFAGAGQTYCDSCPAGRANNQVASQDASACTQCEAGTDASVGSAACRVCAEIRDPDNPDIEFVDHDNEPATPCIPQPMGVVAEATLDLDMSAIAEPAARLEFEAGFAADLASSLGVDASRVVVRDIRGGSLVVNFEIMAADDGVSYSEDALQEAFDTGALAELGGVPVAGLSEVTVVMMQTCPQHCDPGFEDRDCYKEGTSAGLDTECTPCADGSYGPGGIFPRNKCVACAAGKYLQQGEVDHELCTGCPAGKADTDHNSWTKCVSCEPGSIAAEVGEKGEVLRDSQLGYLA